MTEVYHSMRLGGLFAGYGGLEMGAHAVLGAEPAWFVENDPAASAVLSHHWPHVPNFGDITAVDWREVEPVDVLTAGFPCQDISNAGHRGGIGGERSGLWSHVVDACRVLRPRYLLVENVAALVVRGLDTVLTDLAAIRFDAEWTCVPASAVGAPHRRDRWFLVARDPASAGRGEGVTWAGVQREEPSAGCDPAADTAHHGHQRGRGAWRRRDGPADNDEPATHPEGDGRHQGKPASARLERGFDAAERGGAAADADRDGRAVWGGYWPAIDRWQAILGRPAPTPTMQGRRGGNVLNPVFVEWLMGLPDRHVTDVPGLSRNAQLRLLGNGVVPPQAEAAFHHLLGLLTSVSEAA